MPKQSHRSSPGGSGRFVASFAATGIFVSCAVSGEPEVPTAGEEVPATAVARLASTSAAAPGADGIGDPLLPTLGNGGYLVDHYDLGLRYASATPAQTITGTATILAHATQELSRFNLDFAGDSIGAITVNGRAAAAASWEGEELIITPASPLVEGDPFLVTVSFTTTATPVIPNNIEGNRFFAAPSGSAWIPQHDGAHQIFPCNDHPSDKATYSFRIDAPAGTTAIANGELIAKLTLFGRSFSFFAQLQPMATELTQVAVGELTILDRGFHGGVRVRDAVATPLAAAIGPKLALSIEQLAWLQALLGPYPFSSYGSLALDAPLGFALETQTLSVYDYRMFTDGSDRYKSIMAHELAHQWFGDSVAPARWSDVWQSEGHATWYELASIFPIDSAEHTARFRQYYNLSNVLRAFFGPVAAPTGGSVGEVFNPNVYYGGALTLFALRLEVGEATFQQIEREWVRRYRGESPGTADFIALASELAGRDLSAFLTAWLYGATVPAMPGHPDWIPAPAPPSPASAGIAGIGSAPAIDARAFLEEHGLSPVHHH